MFTTGISRELWFEYFLLSAKMLNSRIFGSFILSRAIRAYNKVCLKYPLKKINNNCSLIISCALYRFIEIYGFIKNF